jgi:hypothetical protein
MIQHATKVRQFTGALLCLLFITPSAFENARAQDDKKRVVSPHDLRKPSKRGAGPDRISETKSTGIVRMGPRAVRLPDEFLNLSFEVLSILGGELELIKADSEQTVFQVRLPAKSAV